MELAYHVSMGDADSVWDKGLLCEPPFRNYDISEDVVYVWMKQRQAEFWWLGFKKGRIWVVNIDGLPRTKDRSEGLGSNPSSYKIHADIPPSRVLWWYR